MAEEKVGILENTQTIYFGAVQAFVSRDTHNQMRVVYPAQHLNIKEIQLRATSKVITVELTR